MGIEFGEIITAMVTPFDDEEQIDYSKTEALIEYLIANGSDGLVVAGTTGESPTLTTEEKLALFSFVVEKVDGRVSVIAGTGSNNTRESIELTKKATQCGVDGIMLVAPYYNRPTQAGLYEHFKQIAAATTLPIMLYNIPGRTGVHVAVETIVALAEIDNIVCVKDATANLGEMAQIISLTDDSFKVYSGDDHLTLPLLAIGGAGIVSVSAHVVGNEMKKMVTAFRNGNVKEAGDIHRHLIPTFQMVFSSSNPTPVKAMLNSLGVSVGTVRLPLMPLKGEELARIDQYVKNNLL